MRYLFGLLCVCALGVMPMVGCGEAVVAVECQAHYDCDDQNSCTLGRCDSLTGSCDYNLREPGIPCTFDGFSGVCVSGVCGENLCTGNPCDDGNECTKDICRFRDGSCRNENLNTTGCDWGGVRGVCIDGVCREDLCKGVVCDNDGNPCTEDTCNRDTGECSYAVSPDGTYCGCSDWYWGTCWPTISGYCCADEEHCQNGECV